MFYFVGLVILGFALSLMAQIQMGISPIMSVAYTVYSMTEISLGDATLIWYTIFIAIEIVIHICLKKYKTIPMDLLQFPLSIVFTRFINLFKAIIPEFKTQLNASFGMQLVFLLIAILLTGIGAAMSLDMRVIPNPGDGIVQALADVIHKPIGLSKNFIDIGCVALSYLLGLAAAHTVYGIGIGTLVSMILTGRVMAVFNKCFLKKMLILSGMKTD